MKYSEKELAALISEVESDFNNYLAKAEQEKAEKLKKSEEIVEEEEEVIEKNEDTLAYSDEDINEMDELYASMTKAEKEAHYKSIKKSLFGNEEEETEVIENKEKQLAKSEDKSEEISLLKSELEDQKQKYDKLQKSFAQLIEKLTKSVKKGQLAPERKAITKIEYIAKSEDEVAKTEEKTEDLEKLNKSEIIKRLAKQARTADLKKSDREAINNYCLGINNSLETIKHLL